MDKTSEKTIFADEGSEWSFPDVEVSVYLSTPIEPPSHETAEAVAETELLKAEQEQMNALELKYKQQEEELLAAKAEVEKLKEEYSKKIQLVDVALQKLNNPLRELDKEVIMIIDGLIRKALKKLVYTEIQTNPQTLNKIIDELSKLIIEQGGMVAVQLSEEDYKLFVPSNEQEKMSVKINPALTAGDIVLKANFTEVRAILEERITQLLGMKYV